MEPLPFDPRGTGYLLYTGPCPGFGDHPIGSCGPTTSGRMDGYTVDLLRLGLKGMIGKGKDRLKSEAMQKYKAVYLATVGALELTYPGEWSRRDRGLSRSGAGGRE